MDNEVAQRRTINVSLDDRDAIAREAAAYAGMTIQGMASAMIRGWRMLTPEQQFAAIRNVPPPESPGPASPTPDGPKILPGDAVAELVQATSEMAVVLNDVTRDGHVDAVEMGRLHKGRKKVGQATDAAVAAAGALV